MRRILIFTFVLICFLPFSAQYLSAQENDAQDVSALKEVAKQAKEEVEKEKQELEARKARVEAARKVIAKEIKNFDLPEEGAERKINVIRAREATLKTQENLIREKLETYETITDLVERKLQILTQRNIPFTVFEEEIDKASQELADVEAEKKELAYQISILTDEIRYVEEDINLKKVLLELKGGDGSLKDLLKAQEDRLEAIQERQVLLEKLRDFVQLQSDTIQDHLDSLESELLTRFQRQLFTPQPFQIKNMEKAYLILGILILIGMGLALRRKEKEEDAKTSFTVPLLRFFFIAGVLFLIGYFATFIFGYHLLAAHIGKRVILTTLFFFIAFFLYQGIKFVTAKLLRYSFTHDAHPLDRRKAYYNGIKFIVRWSLIITFIYATLEVWGAGFGGLVFIYKKAQFPFINIGSFKLSLWIIVQAALVVWFFVIFSKVVDYLLYKKIYPRTHIDEGIQYAFSVALKYLFLFTGIFTSLSVLGINLGALTIFAGTVGIGIGFGLQEIAKNFISGIIILIERPIKVGDYIEIEGMPARVKTIHARSTKVTTFDNIDMIVPNAEFMNQRVVNWSHSDKVLRVAISVGVAYGSDTHLVKDTLLEVAKSHSRVLKYPAPYVWFEDFGDSSLNFKLLFWTNDPDNRMTTKSEVNHLINKAFQEKGITIPFPQRDLHIKSQDVPLNFQTESKK